MTVVAVLETDLPVSSLTLRAAGCSTPACPGSADRQEADRREDGFTKVLPHPANA